MKWFMDLKISAKLISAFVLVSLITALVGYVGINNMSTINNMLNDLYIRHMLGLSVNKEANINLLYYDRGLRNYALSKTQEERDKRLVNMKLYENRFRGYMDSVKATLLTAEGREAHSKIMSGFDEYLDAAKELIKEVNAAGFSTIAEAEVKALTKSREKADIVDNLMTDLSVLKEKRGRQAYDDSDAIYGSSRNFLLILIICSVLAGIGLGVFIARIISRPVKKLTEIADKLAVGDIELEVEATTKDEIGLLMQSFKKMIDNIKEQVNVTEEVAGGNLMVTVKEKSDKDKLMKALSRMLYQLKEVVENVKQASDNVATGAQEMSSSSEEMSQGATEQAAAAEEASS
ncbi:MAG: MCP four helix bundle domain-containing protein, partial [Ignavibacteriales bacterium]